MLSEHIPVPCRYGRQGSRAFSAAQYGAWATVASTLTAFRSQGRCQVGHVVHKSRRGVAAMPAVLFPFVLARRVIAPSCAMANVPSLKFCARAIAAATLLLTGTSCAEAQPLSYFGKCWSQGEGFNEVVDDRGGLYRVEPTKLPRSLGVADHWFCGVRRSDAKLVALPEEYSLLGVMSQGFRLPSGDARYANGRRGPCWKSATERSG